MPGATPLHHLWWLVSRASGIVAPRPDFSCPSCSASRWRRGVAARDQARDARLHEHLALAAIAAIALARAALLGDHWLKPGWRGITIPFALNYRPSSPGRDHRRVSRRPARPELLSRRRLGSSDGEAPSPPCWCGSFRPRMRWALGRTPAAWLRAIALVPAVPLAYLIVVRRSAHARHEPPPHKQRGLPTPTPKPAVRWRPQSSSKNNLARTPTR